MAREMRAQAIVLLMIAALGCQTPNGNRQGPLAIVLGALTTLGCILVGGNANACAAAGTAVGIATWESTKPKQGPEHRVPIPPEEPRRKQAVIIIEKYEVAPKEVARGGTVSATTRYLLSIPSKTEMKLVTQSFTLMKDGEVIKQMPGMAEEMKDHGRYEVAWDFPIPANADLGTYELRQVLAAQTRAPEDRTVTFNVVQSVAALTTPGR